MASTKVELVALLIERQRSLQKRSPALQNLITRAREGKFHDWDSDAVAPKVSLVNELRAIRAVDLSDIARRVTNGEFDEEPTMEQLEKLRAEVGADYYDNLFPEKQRGEA
jgi:hypothetical protein